MDSVNVAAGRKASLSDIRTAAESCLLCEILLRAAQPYCDDAGPNADLVRKDAALQVGQKGPRVLRFYVDPEYSFDSGNDIPISFPVLPEAESPARFALLREWLHWCDRFHACNNHQDESNTTLPTRLLCVGDPDGLDYDPGVLNLYCPKQNDTVEYVALSHCWGEYPPTKDNPQFCTTDNNIGARLNGFSFSELPKTFQDAVRVTRELGIQYLWIDSLRMEGVFASAYCTIAATSASNSNAGFLERNGRTEYVAVQDASGKQFYICADIDDFDNDVEKAQLNTRAWVMQERALARRTIHFSANQTYWECGEGVYCENLTRMQSSFQKKYFLLDPNFPKRLLKSGNQRTVEFIHFLFEEYSKRGLTEKTDRCAAVSGLEARIAGSLRCKSRYGIFERHLHRNLLWQASDNKMERIAYNNQQVPSWSWMAYNGGIQFINIPFSKVYWINTLRFDEECKPALITDVGEFRDCTTKRDRKNYAVLDGSGAKRAWIQYDVEHGEELGKERCVVVGKKSKIDDDALGVEKYYILVVRSTSVDAEYNRVGVGLIECEYVVKRKPDVRIV